MPSTAQPPQRSAASLSRAGLWAAGVAGIWLLIALLSTTQGYMSALAHGNPHPWLPAFGTKPFTPDLAGWEAQDN